MPDFRVYSSPCAGPKTWREVTTLRLPPLHSEKTVYTAADLNGDPDAG
jgi:hypothetical protein